MTEKHICSNCHTGFVPTWRNWVGPDETLPMCNACIDAEESYENVAHPVKSRLPHALGQSQYHRTTCPPRRPQND